MCIAFILWHCHPRYRLFIALNRDEYYARPTVPAHWWEQEDILAGKDLLGGGTWFGCTRSGRIALVTSFREPHSRTGVASRGELTTSFLRSSKDPLEYAQEMFAAGDKYNGFNLLVADLCRGKMAYVSNRPRGDIVPVQYVLPGFHVLCNASLNTPWPKVLRGRKTLENLVQEVGPFTIPKERVIEDLLKDSTKADEASLPRTGYPLEHEYELSSVYVNCTTVKGGYGSRSMVIFSVGHDGQAEFFERFLEDGSWEENTFFFDIGGLQKDDTINNR